MNNTSSFGFGSTAANASQAGTLFGAGNPTSTNTSAAGTLFGTNASNSSAAGTLFGGSASTTPGNTGFGTFGKPAATSQPATGFGAPPATPTTGFFGATAPATSAATGFGATPATGSVTSAPFSFGSTPAATTTTGFGGGFSQTSAAPAATSTFGSGLFGAKPATTTATTGFGGGFGGTSNTLFGGNKTGFGTTQQTGFGGMQQQQPAPVPEKVWQELAMIRGQFDPTSPFCNFRHYFYNAVAPNTAHLYVRPQNQDEQLWNEAVRKNPDPANLVPVLVVGFDDILKRMELQSQLVQLHQEKLREAAERLENGHRHHSLETLTRIVEYKRRHLTLTQRLLNLLKYSQVLRYKAFPLSSDENTAMEQIQQIANQENNPQAVRNKINILSTQLRLIQQQRAAMDQRSRADVWQSVRPEDIDQIADILGQEQQGILHVQQSLDQDFRQLESIEIGLRDNMSNRMMT